MTRIDHYPPGKTPDKTTPGDFLLHRATDGQRTTKLGEVIQAGERTRFGDTDAARWTHSALLVNGNGLLIEANAGGVELKPITEYVDSDYVVVHPTGIRAHQRDLACAFAIGQVGDRYGYLNFAVFVVQCLFGWNLSLHMDDQFICSGLVARATEKYVASYPRSPECMMPADLAHYWGVESGEPLPTDGLIGRALDTLVAITSLLR